MKSHVLFSVRALAAGLLVLFSVPSDAAGLFDRCGSGCDSECCDVGGCDTDACGLACCDTCNSIACDGCCGRKKRMLDRLSLGLIKPSDRCFDDFISPMINFVHFEDPRTVTELRPIFLNHWVPSTIGNGVSAGGVINLFAVQFRVALTERLSLIGVKDGYIWESTGGTLDTILDDGWASVTAGLKYNLLRDTQTGTLFSVGGTYEIPLGAQRALQRVGDGEFHLFATGGQRLLCGNAHLMSAFGWRVPSDNRVQSESIHWSNHLDVRLTEKTYLVTEVAWWHWVDSASAGAPLGVAGQDLFNLSASDVTNLNLVTQNIGAKFKPSRSREWGIAYEFPLTENRDVIDGRLQLEAIFRY